MIRNNLRKGMTGLLFVAALMVAGARPAAAESLGWSEAWDWLSGLFGRVTVQQHSVSEDTVGPEDPNGGPTSNGDCGLEIDPNGVPKCKPTSALSPG